jgi:hypothetical protein
VTLSLPPESVRPRRRLNDPRDGPLSVRSDRAGERHRPPAVSTADPPRSSQRSLLPYRLAARRMSKSGRPRLRPAPSQQPSISAAVCAFSVRSRVTQRDGVAGRGHAGKPHLAAPRRPGTHWRAPPRRSGGLTACRSLARWMMPGWHPSACPGSPRGLPASGRQPAIQETSLSSCSIGASRPGLPAHPCAVTHHQPYREGRRAACGTHDGRGYQRHGNPGRPCRRQISAFARGGCGTAPGEPRGASPH